MEETYSKHKPALLDNKASKTLTVLDDGACPINSTQQKYTFKE